MELFVTDLDGTLLNSNKEVSIKSIEILNKLIDDGVNFTVATARTPATVVDLLQDVNLKLPAVLMNGVLLYDIKEEKYINIKEIEKDTVDKVFDILNKFDKKSEKFTSYTYILYTTVLISRTVFVYIILIRNDYFLGSNNIVVFLTIQYYCLSLRHE